MRPSQKVRHGGEAAGVTKRGLEGPLLPLLKHPPGSSQLWPVHPAESSHKSKLHHALHPHLPLFHTRYAEESAERPHLVTIVRPSQSSLRKVTVLLNRRGVASFEQLLLDISEALGFPRWHGGKITRLYTTHAREVKGICDFFQGQAAFLALGKARPDLSSIQEALEELFPEHSHYCTSALKAWQKKLRPPPNKAAKADSGYSDGTDSNGANRETLLNTKPHLKILISAHTAQHKDACKPEKGNIEPRRSSKDTACRKLVPLPNNLQRLRKRGGGVREPELSPISPIKHKSGRGDADLPPGKLCESCLARRADAHGSPVASALSGRVPLPPVPTKKKESSDTSEKQKNLDFIRSPSPCLSVHKDNNKSLTNTVPPVVGPARTDSAALHTEGSIVTLTDIEHLYEFGRVVGDGNFAVVQECRRRDDGRTLAVKIVERSKLIGREHMMQNELSLLGSLRHPRIVRLFSHHHTNTHSYLVMELVSGGDLFEAISERGKFSEAEAGLMVSDVSEALEYIHEKSIVHRDLKPENLLMEHPAAGICRLKLGDFGLAMVVTEPVYTICGTPTYVAPEILHETGYGVAVDVWALGVILYVLLCGFPPFRSRDRDQEELFKIIKQAQLQFPSPYWDSITGDAKGLVTSLLQPDPTLRLTSKQTLQHPWVKAMASVCMKRALGDKAPGKLGKARGEPKKVQAPAVTNSGEMLTDKTENYSGSEEDIILGRNNALSGRIQDHRKSAL